MLLVAVQLSAQAKPDSAKVPFAFANFTWLNGSSRQDSSVLDSKYFTGEFRADVTYIGDFNHRKAVGPEKCRCNNSESAGTFTRNTRAAA